MQREEGNLLVTCTSVWLFILYTYQYIEFFIYTVQNIVEFDIYLVFSLMIITRNSYISSSVILVLFYFSV